MTKAASVYFNVGKGKYLQPQPVFERGSQSINTETFNIKTIFYTLGSYAYLENDDTNIFAIVRLRPVLKEVRLTCVVTIT